MSFNRHRTREQPKEEIEKPIVKVEKKIVTEPKKEIPVKKVEPIKVVKEVVIKEQANDAVNEIKTAVVEEKAPTVVEIIEPEKIEKVVRKEKKKREDKKEFNDIGIVGKTIVANDFRAICKKNGKQINTVLTELLHGWNMANYNL